MTSTANSITRKEAARKAVRTRKRREAARKAVKKRNEPTWKAQHSEHLSKRALESWCDTNGWKVVFFEAKSGSPLTGIVDAVILRAHPGQADGIQFRLVQLKSGGSGVKGTEIKRLRHAVKIAAVRELIACYDGRDLHFMPEDFEE